MLTDRILVTGGAGFMGSCFIRHGLATSVCKKIVNLDLLTYAGNTKNVREVEKDPRYLFVQGDIRDEELVEKLCLKHEIQTIVHFAAETHVDRSIRSPRAFLETNVSGTFALLEVVRRLPHLHLHQISTDEVFGSLMDTDLFHETSSYLPNSPYAASKAAADHFVKSYAHTFGLSFTLSHSSNNYGPYQYPEKFIPRMITCALQKQTLPVYGSGAHIRDWLYVEDHAEAVWQILKKGRRGEVYNIGGGCEKRNLELLHLILEEVAAQSGAHLEELMSHIAFVADRPGHDYRYGLDTSKIRREIGWVPKHDLKSGLQKTVRWYLAQESLTCV